MILRKILIKNLTGFLDSIILKYLISLCSIRSISTMWIHARKKLEVIEEIFRRNTHNKALIIIPNKKFLYFIEIFLHFSSSPLRILKESTVLTRL